MSEKINVRDHYINALGYLAGEIDKITSSNATVAIALLRTLLFNYGRMDQWNFHEGMHRQQEEAASYKPPVKETMQ